MKLFGFSCIRYYDARFCPFFGFGELDELFQTKTDGKLSTLEALPGIT
jgi:hypothetical protein